MMSSTDAATRRRRWLAITALLVGIAAIAMSFVSLSGKSESDSAVEGGNNQASRQSMLLRSVTALQDKLRRLPDDSIGWAELGSAYVELARATADPAYYAKAQGALDRSLRLRPQDNGPAMLGMGALANSRHDFAAAKDWALRAKAVQPDSAEVHGILADALTQLGDDTAATDAVQRMLNLRPGVAAFTRASYHFELHGQTAEAREAMERALASAGTPDELAFCRYYLGELAFNSGRLDEANAQYEQGLAASAQDVTLLQGKAKVAVAKGNLDEALSGYRQVISRAPLAQYILELAELLDVAGRQDESGQQYAVLAEQQRLLAAQGATDDLSAALVAADHGDKAEALRRAQSEWGRRQSVFTADAMAWALHVNGRSAEALQYADKAASLGWRNAAFAYHRGMILASLGKKADAERILAEALEINPHFSPLHAPKAQRQLADLRSQR